MLNIKQGPSFEEQKKHTTTGGVGCNIDEHLNSSEQKIAFGGPITLLLVISTQKQRTQPIFVGGLYIFRGAVVGCEIKQFLHYFEDNKW